MPAPYSATLGLRRHAQTCLDVAANGVLAVLDMLRLRPYEDGPQSLPAVTPAAEQIAADDKISFSF
jgi:hypothetical protein